MELSMAAMILFVNSRRRRGRKKLQEMVTLTILTLANSASRMWNLVTSEWHQAMLSRNRSKNWLMRMMCWKLWKLLSKKITNIVSGKLHCGTYLHYNEQSLSIWLTVCRSLSPLTLSPPIPLRLYTLPYWSNPPFLIFDIRGLWRSVLSARAPECQKLKMVG